MTEKEQYCLHTDITGNCFIVSDDCKFGMFDKLEKKQVIRVIGKLNEQDRQLKRLFNYFQDYLLDEMSANSFSEMFDNVKSDEKWD